MSDRAFEIGIKHVTPKGQFWHLRLVFKIDPCEEHEIRRVNPMTPFKAHKIGNRHTNVHFAAKRSYGVIS
jgi:hypothetical protein